VERRSDPQDGRRAVISMTEAGLELLRSRRDARTERLALALSSGFTPAEVRQLMEITPLIERLAQCI
jgi:DNA-binding MarR family transcriptional regulator